MAERVSANARVTCSWVAANVHWYPDQLDRLKGYQSKMTGFVERLNAASVSSQSLVCVGLDPDPDLMAIGDVAEFNARIVDATRDLVCAYKPNFPFYEALGIPGLVALERTVAHIREVAPEVVLIADCKRGDIGSTNKMYARALFDTWGFDAATVNAWGGGDSVEPYLEYSDRGVIVWCRSSNPGAAEFQDVPVDYKGTSIPLFEWMAIKSSEWNQASSNVGLVAGATYPAELAVVRNRCPGMPILVPGIGSQGGDLGASLAHGLDVASPNVLISSSRGITYASREPGSFESAARLAASKLRDEINSVLDREGRAW